MPPRYNLARRKAQEVLRQGKIKSAPVPVETLARLLGAAIRLEPFPGELSGMVMRRPDGTAVIGVNSIEGPTRQRFTIAHELGHLLMHRDEDVHVDERFPFAFRDPKSSKAIDDKEIEANQFAAELLMPESLLRKDLKDVDLDIETDDMVAKLAAKYQVSTQAMTFRLSRLGVVR